MGTGVARIIGGVRQRNPVRVGDRVGIPLVARGDRGDRSPVVVGVLRVVQGDRAVSERRIEQREQAGPQLAALAGLGGKSSRCLDVGIAEVRQVVAESPRSAELIARLPDQVMLQGMMNRCHNTTQEPMDLPEAQGFPGSAIRRAVWSAWSRAPRPSRSSNPCGREGRIPGGGLGVDVKIEADCPR